MEFISRWMVRFAVLLALVPATATALVENSQESLTPSERQLLDQWHTSEREFQTNWPSFKDGSSGKSFREQKTEDMKRVASALALGKAMEQSPRPSPAEIDRETLSSLMRSAEVGDARAEYEVGLKYVLGQGVERSYERAAAWFRKAAVQNHAEAQANLGYLLASGRGVPPDLDEAMSWWKAAAAGGSQRAAFALWETRKMVALTGRGGETIARGAILASYPDRLFIVPEDGVCCNQVALLSLSEDLQKRYGLGVRGSDDPFAKGDDWKQIKVLEILGQVGAWSRCKVRFQDGTDRALLLANMPVATRNYLQSLGSNVNPTTALQTVETEFAAANTEYLAAVNSGNAQAIESAESKLDKAKRKLTRMREASSTTATTVDFFLLRAKFTGRTFSNFEIWECNQ